MSLLSHIPTKYQDWKDCLNVLVNAPNCLLTQLAVTNSCEGISILCSQALKLDH